MKLLLLLLTFPVVSESWYWIELKGDLRQKPVHFGKFLEPGEKSVQSHRVLPPPLHKPTHSAKIPKPSGQLPVLSKSRGPVDVTARRSLKMVVRKPLKLEKVSHLALSSPIHLPRKHLRTRRSLPLRYYEHTYDKSQMSSNFGAFGFYPGKTYQETRLRKREASKKGETVHLLNKANKKLKLLFEKPKKTVTGRKERLTKEHHTEPEARLRLHLCLAPPKAPAPKGKLAAALEKSLSSRLVVRLKFFLLLLQ